MHRRISTTLNTLRQDLAAKLGATHPPRLPPGRPLVVRQLPLDPSGHYPLVPHPGSPRQHGLDPRLLAGRPLLHRQRLCQARARLPLAVFQTVLRAVVKILVPATEVAGLWFGHRVLLIDGSSLPPMPDVAALASLLRPAGQPGQGLRLPGGPHPGVVPRRHRAAAGGFRGRSLRSHDMAGVGGILPLLKRAMCWWPTADSARSLIWRCSSARASMRYFACTRSRSSTSRRAVPMPGPVRSGHPRGCRAPLGVGLRPDGSSGRIFQAGAVPRVDDADEYRKSPESIMVRELRYRIDAAGVPDAQSDAGDHALGRRGVPG